jgi:hypothetical protein
MFGTPHALATLKVLAIAAYLLVIAFYSYLMLTGISLLSWKLIRALLNRRRSGKPLTKRTVHRKASWIKRLNAVRKRNLFLNFVLAVGSTGACFAVLAELPIKTKQTLLAASVLACVVPFVWGFLRTASIGNHSGAIGVFIGLLWLAIHSSELAWIDSAPYFFVINVAGNLSGWLGAAAGQGQKRDSVGVGIIELRENLDQTTLIQLSNSVREGVQETIYAIRSVFRFRRWPEKMILADRDGRRDVLDYTELMEWRKREFPQIRLWAWFREIEAHSFNEIVDNATSVLRFTVIRAEIKLSYNADVRTKRAQIFITTFNETSTIVWVDKLGERRARRIHHTVLSDLRSKRIACSDEAWAILHRRQGEPNIEQWAKHTLAAAKREHVLKKVEHPSQSESLLKQFEQAFITETWFDQFRGKKITFTLAIILEVGLGFVINWLLGKMFPG